MSLRGAGGPPSLRLRGVAGDALQLPFRGSIARRRLAFEVIEHLPDVGQALDETLRVLRRPGYIIIGLPNHASLWTPIEDRLRGRTRLAFGVERGRGAWRWWRRNAGLAWRKRVCRAIEFLYREPILDTAQGGDADAVYYAAPLICCASSGVVAPGSSPPAHGSGWAGSDALLPVELQGSTVMAWRIN